MMKRPTVDRGPEGVRNKDKLRTWLAAWRADRLLADGEVSVARAILGLRTDHRTGQGLKPGAILLLQPGCPAAAARPRYAAVLHVNAETQELTVVPFSRMGCPAVPGELLMTTDSLPVRVLCLWNARRVSALALPPLWRVGRLTSRQVIDALAVGNCASSGRCVPEGLEERVGPPLQHPLDPRHDYIAEERDWVDACLSQSPAIRSTWAGRECGGREPESYLLAAEEKARYRPARKRRGGGKR